MFADVPITRLTVGYLTDPGITRDFQEDNLGYFSPIEKRDDWPWARLKGSLFVVADGVGGREMGEIASALAVSTILDEFYGDRLSDIQASLLRAVEAANRAIVAQGTEQGAPGRMRTTFACAVIRGEELLVVNAGDSRVYLVREGQAEQLSQDHTWVAQQVRAGQLSPEQARHHPRAHIVTQTLGNPQGVEPDSRWEELRVSDLIILCTDGLYGVVEPEEIAQVVSRSQDPQAACNLLVDRANENTGPDNISVIVIRVEQVKPETAPAGQALTPLAPGFGVRPAVIGVKLPYPSRRPTP